VEHGVLAVISAERWLNRSDTGNIGVDVFPGPPLVTVSTQTRRAVAAAVTSVCLAAGCSGAGLMDDSSAAAAPAPSVDAAITGGGSIAPVASVAAAQPAIAPPLPVVPSLPTPPPALPTLQELLAEEQFLPLAFALERSGLDDLIAGLDEFVLIAPTETAFATGGADVGIEYSTLIDKPRLLDAFLRYQIVADPSTNESWRTMNGAPLDVEGTDPATIDRVNGVAVVERIPVRDGTVLVMPRLLLPATEPVGAAPVGSQPPADD
jgi:hypothetical protein